MKSITNGRSGNKHPVIFALLVCCSGLIAVFGIPLMGSPQMGLIASLCLVGLSTIAAFALSRPLSKSHHDTVQALAQLAKGSPDGDAKPVTGRGAPYIEAIRGKIEDFESQASENTYKTAAFKGSSAATMITDSDFNIKYMNPSVTSIIEENEDLFARHVPGFSTGKVLGANMDSFHKDPTHARRILEDPANLPYEADISLEDKRFALEVSAISKPGGGILGYVVEWKDVTQERLNKSILQALEDYQCTVQIDRNGTINHINGPTERAYGEGFDKLIGGQIEDLFAFNPDLAQEKGAVWERLRRGESVYGKFKLNCPGDRQAWIEGGFSPVMDKRNSLVSVAFIGTDRTEAEAALREAEILRRTMEEAQNLVVDQLTIALERVSSRDLTSNIDVSFSEEYEELRRYFNNSMQDLLKAMLNVMEVSRSINADAESISGAALDLSQRTEKQAATLEETAAALDQLTASVKQAATGAAEADRIVSEARQSAQASGEIVGETVNAMGQIEESSQQISKIISVIDDIAFQTNLLALNAGVEAARAGEAGRGFAVVASEVRALAQRSSEAANEINALITESTSHVQHGVRLVDRTGEALEQIVNSVGDISEHVSQIAQSAQEQSVGLAEINTAVNQLDQATQQNAAMFEETSAASSALLQEAKSLSDTMGQFQLGQGTTQPAASEPPKKAEPPVPAIPPQPKVAAAHAPAAAPAQQEHDAEGWEDF